MKTFRHNSNSSTKIKHFTYYEYFGKSEFNLTSTQIVRVFDILGDNLFKFYKENFK